MKIKKRKAKLSWKNMKIRTRLSLQIICVLTIVLMVTILFVNQFASSTVRRLMNQNLTDISEKNASLVQRIFDTTDAVTAPVISSVVQMDENYKSATPKYQSEINEKVTLTTDEKTEENFVLNSVWSTMENSLDMLDGIGFYMEPKQFAHLSKEYGFYIGSEDVADRHINTVHYADFSADETYAQAISTKEVAFSPSAAEGWRG